ncbi:MULTISPECIES: hypothetical protein [Curtobacterium]|uniref:hypothetical protein n=1 Tax=Curtobacterium TaxID=2034 RepID=UPI001BDF6D4B|nr:hypothetical protein [Curtobacterium flaccumfaciens]MBT1674267.1 hypothetical protein [Curtobacterium flaccumfaciens pv. flaccumfaciens]MBT1677017.1 hypothetical protein [Curtobacterium flaccumfaciens pv. flaccumfaciens]
MGRLFNLSELQPEHALFCGRIWEPQDLEGLSRAIADLALGQCAHVEAILRTAAPWHPISASYAVDAAIKSLTVPAGKDPWHRDGWVFQFISWIVAIEESPALTRAPQMDQASKGFDGFQLELDPITGRVKRAVVFEDKATDSPRDTVREKVWPEFEDIEAGHRHPAIATEIGALLRGRWSTDEIIEIVDRIMRTPDGLAYRASLTAGSYHVQSAGFNGLFDGFESSVSGDRLRRQGNVLEVEDLRSWMDSLCDRAIALLEASLV